MLEVRKVGVHTLGRKGSSGALSSSVNLPPKRDWEDVLKNNSQWFAGRNESAEGLRQSSMVSQKAGEELSDAKQTAALVFLQQKKAIRILAEVPSTNSCRDLFRRYNAMTSTWIYIIQCLEFIHKHKSVHQQHATVHSHLTRTREKYILPQHRLMKTYTPLDLWEQRYTTYCLITLQN
ncbi:hypothetical protein HHI36_004226 [Cryptolaemus montrouzieri]|uniref:Uncharacterized protein n=1 Tax=Cryptolaemus montrouzieri TaxID=559131 RepID=A0ABD2NQJ6_9CUCU